MYQFGGTNDLKMTTKEEGKYEVIIKYQLELDPLLDYRSTLLCT